MLTEMVPVEEMNETELKLREYEDEVEEMIENPEITA